MNKSSVNESSYVPRTEMVYQYIAEQLLDGTLQPGDRLNRRKIAERLEVSVSPVGEALVRLENEGIVETKPRKATVIRVLDKEAIRDQVIVRVAIECQGARLYCGAPVRDHYKRLAAMAKKLDKDLKKKTIDMPIIRRDIDFHRSLLELAESRSLLRYYDQVMQMSLLLSSRLFSIQQSPGLLPPALSHAELVKTLTTDHPDKAERAIRSVIEDKTFLSADELGN